MSRLFAARSSILSLAACVAASTIAVLACRGSAGAGPDASKPVPQTPVLPTAAPATQTIPQLSTQAPIEDERNTIAVFRATAPAAVFVTQKRVVMDYWGSTAEVAAGSGSGFVWDKQGHVVTNFHVIQNARSVTVTLQDQSTHEAVLRGVEPRKDIAVLKINAPADKLVPISLPDKKAVLEVGQKAIAIGNPFGLDHTLTVGVISALGRSVDGIGGVEIRDMVQTDAAINPGNSGGPLFDSGGRLIGMNTMIFSKSGASAGVGFAVPVNTIQRVVPQIIKTGRAEQVGLGIRIDVDQRFERRSGIRGVIVISVQPGSPAAKAGLRGVETTPRGVTLGDIIVGIDQTVINDYDDLYNTLDAHQAGDKVKLKVKRGNKVVELETTLINVQ